MYSTKSLWGIDVCICMCIYIYISAILYMGNMVHIHTYPAINYTGNICDYFFASIWLDMLF